MNTKKNSDEFTKQLLKAAGTETPSAYFVNKVMENIHAENTAVTTYKPVISKKAWFFIGIIAAALVFFILTGTNESPSFLSEINFGFLSKLNIFSVFKGLHFSTMFTYSFVLFSIFMLLQLVAIDKYVSKQNSL